MKDTRDVDKGQKYAWPLFIKKDERAYYNKLAEKAFIRVLKIFTEERYPDYYDQIIKELDNKNLPWPNHWYTCIWSPD